MLSEQLLNELHKLNRTEKLQIVQILVNELTLEESAGKTTQQPTQYEVWSPYDAFEAANRLQAMLNEYRNN
jgi:hypothetical protein